ncbi:thioredoxin family protein [Bacillus methanolicus]|uniref:Thioredoxin-like protein n=1 Tax=Bacillus methanolicus (strain MGA3 / ATCC 53907) TaxID=796606 RepID=I3E793_BACMM|nr:thioredoxin family protein [Bacillus methanolicus]AIE59195.1 thioredoxin-like protein [Bacillus methanolicus MGA3]EIJ82364.1 thioredoxin-like protein [Bacillus methanolicus MGA3]
MKKVIIFLAIIIVLFAGVAILNNIQQKEKISRNNPYGKDNLHPETVKQLDDPNYQNIILPEELKKKLKAKEDVTVYFFSPTCPHCQRTTPIVVPLSKKMGINLVLFNLLEFENGWDDFGITETPTIVQYKHGKEISRITGYNEKSVFEKWFNKYSK